MKLPEKASVIAGLKVFGLIVLSPILFIIATSPLACLCMDGSILKDLTGAAVGYTTLGCFITYFWLKFAKKWAHHRGIFYAIPLGFAAAVLLQTLVIFPTKTERALLDKLMIKPCPKKSR